MPAASDQHDALRQALSKALAERYRIDSPLGHGGMGVVFHAYDRRHDRAVAIKVLREEVSATLGDARFQREIQVTAGLSHPNVLALLDSGEVDGHLFFVAPFIDGGSLRDFADRREQIPLSELLPIVRELGAALDFAHRHNIVHRDIKPDNVFLIDGHAVLGDFGLARAIHAVGGAQLTQSGIAIGSPAYMSPEQAFGRRDLDGRSDLYSFGCLIFEILTGEVPYSGSDISSVLRAHAERPPPDVRALRPDIPAEVSRVLKQAMAKQPKDRHATVGDFVRALERASERRGLVSTRAALIGTAIIILAGIAALVVALAT